MGTNMTTKGGVLEFENSHLGAVVFVIWKGMIVFFADWINEWLNLWWFYWRFLMDDSNGCWEYKFVLPGKGSRTSEALRIDIWLFHPEMMWRQSVLYPFLTQNNIPESDQKSVPESKKSDPQNRLLCKHGKKWCCS
jgi:hypothetical protein